MDELPDKRSLGMPGVPYSAYCRQCWGPYYRLCTGEHDGSCVLDAEKPEQCQNALNSAKNRYEFIKLRNREVK